MPELDKYLAKRHFGHTPEPKASKKVIATKIQSKPLSFVVQQHQASHLHYDFRLELDGVLKSWAVPKGPSMNPHDHHLAVMVEDHPFEYRKFEGIIPAGNYGAGNVVIWDSGTYEPRQESDDPAKALRSGLKKGHLTFILHGKKLKGEFALIKMPDQKANNWLLVKKDDGFANTKSEALSIDKPEINLKDYPKETAPWPVTPMLCTLVEQPFDDSNWLFEIKWDGYRAIAGKHGSKIQLYSRTGQDFSKNYPPIFEALSQLENDVILDGEIVVVDKTGKPHFEWLQNWREDPQGELVYYVFDILWLDGHDIRTMPLLNRKQLLATLLPRNTCIRYSDHVETDGQKLFKLIHQKGSEGIVAKKANSPYKEGKRGNDWLKIKTQMRQEVVIGGYTEPQGGRQHIGSLLVGVYNKGEFVYVGHSGGGMSDKHLKDLHTQLKTLEQKVCPFNSDPKSKTPVHWVRPILVCEMSFSEWTSDGLMRHPKYEGLRSDKKPKLIHKELPSPQPNKSSDFTHLNKIFFPKHKYTKGDLVDYYRTIAPYILPYIKDRPLSLLRQPGGITDKGFFQKNNEHLPSWVPAVDIYSDSNKADLHWIVGGDLETLLYAVQLGSIEINPWNSRTHDLDKPDWAVIDLDPEGVTFKDVVKVALTVKQVCDDWGVPCYPKTSGKTGLHIYIPLQAKYTHVQAKNFSHLIALEINQRQPKLTSVVRMPTKRLHKIYVDFLQNREGQTLAAPYSVRPTPDATVSTPLHWDEVTPNLTPTQFTIKNIPRRLSQTGDLWQPVMGKGIDLEQVLDKIKS
ncbi:MAG TPA: DNA ligase D [Patescibacteria group bacterium]|jgi:bifunctional non-homologous end joining protein LigD|nr:DNA ligase D [Patescibacteria group bacterium]